MNPSQIIVAVVTRNLRPSIPAGCPSNLARLMSACWDADPDKRPEMEVIIDYLKKYTNSFDGEVITNHSVELDNMIITLGKQPLHILNFNQLQPTNLLKSNSLCEIYSGSMVNNNEKKNVLIKLFNSSNELSRNCFSNELDIYGKFSSPALPNFIGHCLDPKLCIATEIISPNLKSFLMDKV